ncbi:MAG: hypothetical protein IPO81_09545 [Kouleothrix sp.]|nr:hypothetical protein [Kouleothrix sp.]
MTTPFTIGNIEEALRIFKAPPPQFAQLFAQLADAMNIAFPIFERDLLAGWPDPPRRARAPRRAHAHRLKRRRCRS